MLYIYSTVSYIYSVVSYVFIIKRSNNFQLATEIEIWNTEEGRDALNRGMKGSGGL